jgi:hypothetical protein
MPAAGAVICLAPVTQGDVYRVARTHPRAIGIIDGYFDGVPSVWHKEILWAMTHGIHVFGSASMGALRAAELHKFGMRGVGRIFEDYRDGRLEDDDEVAVLHGPSETGFVPISEPMVNIRATLARAAQGRVIGTATAQTLCDMAKQLFYQDRTWDALFDRASAQGLLAEELRSFQDWLPDGKVDLKREDALAMLTAMRELLASEAPPKRVTYSFEWTDMWDEVTTSSPAFASDTPDDAASLPPDRLIDELRLEGDRFRQMREQALLRFLAVREADRRCAATDRKTLRAKIDAFRVERGLFNRKSFDAWLQQNNIGREEFERFMEEEGRLENLAALVSPALGRHLIAQLQTRGDYTRLRDRAQRKQRVLASLGRTDPDPDAIGMAPPRLLAWYFQRLGQPIPEVLDAFVRDLGLTDRGDFYRLLAREYLYWQHENNS